MIKKIKALFLVIVIAVTVHAGMRDLLRNIPATVYQHPRWALAAALGASASIICAKQFDRYLIMIIKKDLGLDEKTDGMMHFFKAFNMLPDDYKAIVRMNCGISALWFWGLLGSSAFTLYSLAKVTGIKK